MNSCMEIICDRILENLPFWHIGQCDGNHSYLLAFGVRLHSKKVYPNVQKSLFKKKICEDFQLSFLKSLLVPKRYIGVPKYAHICGNLQHA